MTLDEAERNAIEQVEALRREFELRAAPYIKIISDIRNTRPQVFYAQIENGQVVEMVPIQLPHHQESDQ
jgi:hypothetical protein